MKLIFLFTLTVVTLARASGSVENEANDVLNVQLGLASSASSLSFKNSLISSGSQVTYNSNSGGTVGISLGYRNLGFSLASSVPPEEVAQKGISKQTDYSVRFLGRNSYSARYQKNTGYYIKDSVQADGTYLRKPDLQTEKIHLEWIHNFYHQDLSLPAVFSYSGRQLEPNWTFLTIMQLNKSLISDNSSVIEVSQQGKLPEFSQYKKIDRTSASLGVGLAGALSYQNFQLGLLVTAAGSLEEKKFTNTNDVTTRDSTGSSAANAFLNFGYNAKKHQFGMTILISNYALKVGPETLDESTQEFRLFYGYRFSGVNLGETVNTVSSWLD